MASPFTPSTIPSSGSTTTDGWNAFTSSLAYGSADSPTFTITCAGVDLTSTISVGMRIKLTQTTAKYFIVTAIAFSTDTTITVYGGTDYTLVNAAITSPYYSQAKAPIGFPLDPAKWTASLVDTSNRSQASPVAGTWYNLGSLSLTIPIGAWNVDYQVTIENQAAAGGSRTQNVTLSTANNSESDAGFSTQFYANSVQNCGGTVSRSKQVTVASKTPYYLNSKASASSSTILFLGAFNTTIRAVCAYL